MEWLMVAIGGGVGAALRYGVQQVISKTLLASYWATIIVNLLGSFFLGAASQAAIEQWNVFSFLTIGVLGAFTTFSTFSFDFVKLIDDKQWLKAVIYSVANLIGGLTLFWIGWLL